MFLKGANFYQLLLLIVYVRLIHAFKLNNPRVLIAYNTGLPSNFSLRITDFSPNDCFNWKSQNVHLVHVEPVFVGPNCSREAVISVVSSAKQRKVTPVSAFLKGTETGVACDVITDFPHKIDLSWTTDEIFLGAPPERVTVIAKDQFGHIFNSINGMQTKWKMETKVNEAKKADENIATARFKSFSASNYSLVEGSNGWEIRGLLADTVLVEALNEGLCIISATLVGKKNLSTSSMELKISSAPTRNYNLLRQAIVHLPEETKEGNIKEFDVSIENPDVVKVAENTVVTALDYGRTHLTYKKSNHHFSQVDFEVRVVKPARLELRTSRGGFAIFEEMQDYTIFVELYDEFGNEIHPSDNLRLVVKFPTKILYLQSSLTANGTQYVVRSIAPGKGIIQVEFKGILLPDGSLLKEYQLSESLTVTVCQKLEIFPPSVFLPSNSLSDHEVRLMVTGGTGNYEWTLSDESLLTLRVDEEKSHVGYLKIDKNINKNFSVIVNDRSNVNFFASAKISVEEIEDIEVYPTVVEAEVGNTLILPVALRAYECKDRKIMRKFDDCSKIKLEVEIIEKHVLAQDEDPHIPAFGKGCITIQFLCKQPGYSRVNIFYEAKSEKNKTLKTTTVLSCYKDLKPVYPVRAAVLALGSTMEVAFEGGPRKWPLFKTGHYTTVKASDPNLIDTQLIKDPIRYNRDLTVFRVLCKSLGESVLTFEIGNQPSATNPHPAKSETSIKLFCGEPSSVHLKLHASQTKKKILDENTVKVPFYGNKLFEVDVSLKDIQGRKFANISSLQLEFSISDDTLTEPDTFSGFESYDNAVAGYRKVSRNFKQFKMTGMTGKLEVHAKVNGYNESALANVEISTENLPKLKEISGSIDLKLVSLRDIHNGLVEENSCDSDSCKT